MWDIFKAELDYNKNFLIITFSIFIIPFVVFLVVGLLYGVREESVRALRAVMYAAIGVIFLNKNVKHYKEKRDRFCILLPLSIKHIGIIRIVSFVMLWLSMMIIFWIFNFITGPVQPKHLLIWDMFSLTGIVLFYNAFAYLYRDLNNNFPGKSQKITIKLIYIVLVPLLYSLFIFQLEYLRDIGYLGHIRIYLSKIYFSISGSIIVLFLGLGLSFLDIFFFSRSKSYLE